MVSGVPVFVGTGVAGMGCWGSLWKDEGVFSGMIFQQESVAHEVLEVGRIVRHCPHTHCLCCFSQLPGGIWPADMWTFRTWERREAT